MMDFAVLNFDEKRAVEDLRTRMKKFLPPEMHDDSILFYRFLKARDFDVRKAEIMLKKHLKWRKVFQVDTMLETFKPKEVFRKYFTAYFIGFDKDGDIIRYLPSGNIDSRDIMKCMKMNDFEKHIIYVLEESLALLKEECKKSGRNRFQGILIFNLDKLTIANATNKITLERALRATHLFQDNYPETLKAAFIINAPAFYVIIFSVLRKVMSNAMIQKFHVFGRNGWKEALLKCIDASVLPACLGGSRTDPDGNPLCLTIMHHGGKISPEYYLANDERYFRDMSLVKTIIVAPMSKNTISVDVKEFGSWIQWEFECKYKDVEFGLFLEDNENEVEVLPMHRFTTSDGTETGSYKTESVGKYRIIFGNSYSWFTPKEVHYTVTVLNPDS